MMKLCPNIIKHTCPQLPVIWRCSSTTAVPIISRPLYYYVDLNERRNNVALVDKFGTHTYGDLSSKSQIIAKAVKETLRSKCGRSNKISFLCENDSSYINTLLGIWKAGQVAVPLCKTHPSQTLEYYVNDSESAAIIATEGQINKILPFAKNSRNYQVITYEDIMYRQACARKKEDESGLIAREKHRSKRI